ncbi:serine--tRNA ligase [Mycoplasma sp. Mirounga ES2805-ORL]|uniref:serine--tRNA ligase n=1 Tax=Mycoplasma sp. Mirounga ES2805-ORL TaxID=754514 RepID=UPI00197C0BF2|nr:serine--tRNA ligase [Mycoplasma sp. Mirounga ES2805-ORL]QSF13518.1 serine--tRNA ligase [Mycoplasma sp. Mirounga ES2805-ORL]
MLNIKYILDNEEIVKEKLNDRNFDLNHFNKFLKFAKKRGKAMFQAQQKRAELSKFSKEFAKAKSKEEISLLQKEVSIIKAEASKLEEEAKVIEQKVNDMLYKIPNISLDDVPKGLDENQNVVLKTHDKLGRGLVNNVVPHYEIGLNNNLLDFDKAAKLSGSRYVIYKNKLAKLIRAIQNFMLDLHTKNGYEEYNVPVIVNPEILFGTGQLPKFEEDLYKLKSENKYLIPTAEVPLTNLFNNEIVDLSKPIRLTAFTECFRSEAGSGGKDMKGIIRLHQFKKVELVKITSEEDSINEFNQMVDQAKLVLEELELPFRELLLCTGDLGFSSRKTIDLEVWLPSEMKFREISSVSYMGDFQARRAMIRYKKNNETKYAFTMNGSGLAIDRLLAAILENYQNADGTISIPKKLIPYFGADKLF